MTKNSRERAPVSKAQAVFDDLALEIMLCCFHLTHGDSHKSPPGSGAGETDHLLMRAVSLYPCKMRMGNIGTAIFGKNNLLLQLWLIKSIMSSRRWKGKSLRVILGFPNLKCLGVLDLAYFFLI